MVVVDGTDKRVGSRECKWVVWARHVSVDVVKNERENVRGDDDGDRDSSLRMCFEESCGCWQNWS